MAGKFLRVAILGGAFIFLCGLFFGCGVDVGVSAGEDGVAVGVHAGIHPGVDVDDDPCGVDVIMDVDHDGFYCDTDSDGCCDPCPADCAAR